MGYSLDADEPSRPLTAAERKAMNDLFDEVMEIIARAGRRTIPDAPTS